MTIAYGDRHFGRGTIGGRGFWLARQRSPLETHLTASDFGIWNDIVYNTNLTSVKRPEDALVYDDRLLAVTLTGVGINQYGPIEFGSGVATFLPFLTGTTPADGSCQILVSDSPLASGGVATHAGVSLLNSRYGVMLESADRIQVGEAGYTDPLPGLFLIRIVAGSINPGVSAQVTIEPYNNVLELWKTGVFEVQRQNFWNYGTVDHPYLRGSSDPVTVDLSAGNHNLHVIPGHDLVFVSTPSANAQAVISVGYEYLNNWSDVGSLGEINGRADFYFPTASYHLIDGAGGYYCADLFAESGYMPKLPWKVFNVSGALQEECKITVSPLVRLSQERGQRPFEQWYMGFTGTLGLAMRNTAPYVLTLHSRVVGSPATISIACSSSIDLTIREIDPITYQPTGVVHYDASGLKCDGTTLYRWDAMLVYFVLSASADNGDTADVWIKHGCEIERIVGYTTSYQAVRGPCSRTIGNYDKIVGSSQNLPGKSFVADGDYTGQIQTQGHELQIPVSYPQPTHTLNVELWYNHWTYFMTAPRCVRENHAGVSPTDPVEWTDPAGDDLHEWALMVTCADPRYFLVLPMTARRAYKPFANQSFPGGVGTSQAILKASGVVGLIQAAQTLKAYAAILPKHSPLLIRVNQITEEMAELLSEHGIDIGG